MQKIKLVVCWTGGRGTNSRVQANFVCLHLSIGHNDHDSPWELNERGISTWKGARFLNALTFLGLGRADGKSAPNHRSRCWGDVAYGNSPVSVAGISRTFCAAWAAVEPWLVGPPSGRASSPATADRVRSDHAGRGSIFIIGQLLSPRPTTDKIPSTTSRYCRRRRMPVGRRLTTGLSL